MTTESGSNDIVSVRLPRNHALVLFDFLSRYSDTDRLEIVDQAEQRALWDLGADLETVLAEPLRDDYQRVLEEARLAVRDREE